MVIGYYSRFSLGSREIDSFYHPTHTQITNFRPCKLGKTQKFREREIRCYAHITRILHYSWPEPSFWHIMLSWAPLEVWKLSSQNNLIFTSLNCIYHLLICSWMWAKLRANPFALTNDALRKWSFCFKEQNLLYFVGTDGVREETWPVDDGGTFGLLLHFRVSLKKRIKSYQPNALGLNSSFLGYLQGFLKFLSSKLKQLGFWPTSSPSRRRSSPQRCVSDLSYLKDQDISFSLTKTCIMISSHRNFGKPIMSIFGFSDFTLYLMGQTNAKDVKLRSGNPKTMKLVPFASTWLVV